MSLATAVLGKMLEVLTWMETVEQSYLSNQALTKMMKISLQRCI